jgi:very-short-patch-repair endonuclease
MTQNVEHLGDVRVASLASRQHGVVTVAQLLSVGVSRTGVKRRVASGRLHPLHRGVYAVGHRNLSDHALFVAAVYAVGSQAALSHVSAAHLYGLVKTNRARRVDVSTSRRLRSRPGIRLHAVRSLEATIRRRIPVTTPPRTLLDLGDVLPVRQHERAVHEAEVQRLVTIATLQAQIARTPGRKASKQLEAIIAPGPAPTRSALEDAMLALVRANGLPPPTTNARIGTDEVDLYFQSHRLVVELDGRRYHDTAIRRRRDAAKQARLQAAGLQVLRFDWRDVTTESAATMARLRQALADPAILRPG